MKMNVRKTLTILFVSVILNNITDSIAQTKISEGKAEFSIELPSEGMDEQYKAMMPTEATIYFKDDKSRTEMQMAMMTMVTIYNAKENSVVMLMDMMGKKTAVKNDMKEEAQKADDYKVEVTDETKTIAGYKCTKAIVTGKEDVRYEIWFTSEIQARNSANTQFKGIEGFPMKYEMPLQNMEGVMKMECKLVKAEPVSDEQFNIPDGYEVKTANEMKKQYGGK